MAHVAHTWNGTVLVRTGTEQLRSKRYSFTLPQYIFMSLIGAIFINNLGTYYINQPLSISSAVMLFTIDKVNRSAVFNDCNLERDFKSEYFFRMCSSQPIW